MRAPQERLRDILEAIEAIERYAVHGREAFDRDELIRSWMVRHLAVIGEAAVQLGRDFHAAHPDLPWAQIVGMRNILIHEYFAVDPEEIWGTVEKDLPDFKRRVEGLLRQLDAVP